MDNILLKYFEDRFQKEKETLHKDHHPAPVITISREYGCPAREISQLLLESLKALPGVRNHSWKWKLISKEILQESAKELDLAPSKIKFVFTAQQRSVFDDVVDALRRHQYKPERTIRHTISEVVKGMASKGNLIIIGMGAAGILSGHPNVLNVRLIGPFDWRVDNICRWQHISKEKARALTMETDEIRHKVLHSFLPPKQKEPHFDITINCLNVSTSETVEIITGLVAHRLK